MMTIRNALRIAPACLLLAATAAGQAQSFFGPAATVNGVEIPRARVQAQTDHLVNQRGLGSGGMTQPGAYRKIQEEVVEQLVVQELLWQEAQERGYVVDDAEVDAELEEMKSGFQSDLQFQFSIKEGGYTEETFRENIRQQMSVRRMIAAGVEQAVVVDDEAVEAFYDQNIDQMAMPERIRARHILIQFDKNDEQARADAEQRMAEVQQELAKGANFAILATERSEGPSANQGGDLGYFERGRMVAPFEDAAFALEPGEVSDVVETEFGFHLIRLEDRIEGGTATLADAGPKIRDFLEQQGYREYVERLVEDLRAEGDVEIHLW